MPWFKVDDDLARHPKILGISRRDRASAMGLWCLAGAWSAANLTDGLVPEYLPHELGCSKRLAEVLVEAGLWEPEGRAWRFHDWAERQPSRDQTLARRQADKERQQRHRQERELKRRSEQVLNPSSRRDTEVTNGTVTPAPTRTRPDPYPTPKEDQPPRKRGTRLPEGFAPTEDLVLWAKEHAPNAGMRDHEAFKDYWSAQPGSKGVKTDWDATWRNWMRRASDDRDTAPKASFAPAKPSSQPEIYEDENGVYKRRWK